MRFFEKFEHLHMKNNDIKNVYLSLFIGLFGTLLIVIGGSYAYLTDQDLAENSNTISAGTLSLEFKEESSNNISLIDAVPELAQTGMGHDPFTFKVHNNGTLPIKYSIKLKSACTAKQALQNGITPDLCIPIDYIRVAVQYGQGDTYEVKTPQNGAIELSGLTQLGVDETSDVYSIKMWLDEQTPNTYSKTPTATTSQVVAFAGQLELYGEQILEQTS